MNHPLLDEVETTLSEEERAVLRLRKTPASRALATRRKELLAQVREAARLRDLRLLISIELAIVRGDLLRYANSKGMRASLRVALEELLAVEVMNGRFHYAWGGRQCLLPSTVRFVCRAFRPTHKPRSRNARAPGFTR